MHRVSEVREEWIPTAFRSATGGGWKVLYIAEADRMNEAAANAFLKALEEPPSHTVWVLQVTDPLELPDTVLSRCRALPFTAWGPAELDTEARQLGLDDPDERTLAVRACLGAPTRLHRLAGDGGLDAYRFHRGIPGQLRSQGPAYSLVAAKAIDEEVKRHTAATKAEGKRELDELTTVYGDDVPKAVSRQVADRASRRERELRTEVVRAALDDVVAWYRDCLLVEAGGPVETAINHDAGTELFAEAEPLGPAGLLRAVDLVLETRDRLESNVQQSLALEALFMQLSALTRGG
jgi:DNA polymerase-3 subunit delta'